MRRFDLRHLALTAGWLLFVVGCEQGSGGGGEAAPTFQGVQKPAGTAISGTVPDDVTSVSFVSSDGTTYDVGYEIDAQFEWALPEGTYTVVVGNPGGESAKLAEPLTVGSSAVTLNISGEGLKWGPAEESAEEGGEETQK